MKRERKNNSCDMETTQGGKRNKFLELGVMSSKEHLKIELKGGSGQNISVCLFYKPESDRRFQVEF